MISGELTRASFHDPDGSVYLTAQTVWRSLTATAGSRLQAFLETPIAQALQSEGVLPATRRLQAGERPAGAPLSASKSDAVWFEHQFVGFVGYPHEWLAEQLHEAGMAMVALARRLRAVGWDLKDCNARNIVFRGLTPLFVDFGSFVRRDDAAALWRPAGQLQRHVLLPLLLHAELQLQPAAMLLARPDGIGHQDAHAALRGWRTFKPDVFWTCAVPAWLARFHETSGVARSYSPEVTRAATDATVRSLERRLRSIGRHAPPMRSAWAGYEQDRLHYAPDQLALKRSTIERWLKSSPPAPLLDIGTNGGEFANLAASNRYGVVSIDNDPGALTIARAAARRAGLPVLHLVVDFASPTPALGWCGRECQSFDQRCEAHFEVVMALAVAHHIMVAGGIPLDELVAKLARYTRRELWIEYVDPRDVKFAQIATRHQLDFSGLNDKGFECALRRHFDIAERVPLIESSRTLYRCMRRPA